MSVKPEHYDLIRKPIITEKATLASEHGARGLRGGDGRDQAARSRRRSRALFNVKVKAVNTTVTKGKVKKFRGRPGTRRDVKKAYVTLVEGNTIDVTTGL